MADTREIHDEEFGGVSIRYYPSSRAMRFRLTPKGKLAISAPIRTPKIVITHALRSNRTVIRNMIAEHRKDVAYTSNMSIGKSHRLAVVSSSLPGDTRVKTKDRIIYAHIKDTDDIAGRDIQQLIQAEVIKALRKEAKAYLPRRLRHLADLHGYSYTSSRLTHAGTRWGSCSSSGTISLNIALMKLDLELIDYVIIHELCHTVEMNHSEAFWQHVEQADPDYKLHRKILKKHSPAL